MPLLILSLLITVIYSQSILEDGGLMAPNARGSGAPEDVSHMEGVRVVSTRDGERQWVLNSRRVEIAGTRASLEIVEAELMGLNMKVSAPEGEYDMDGGSLRLKGGVHIAGPDYRVETLAVFLEPASGELSSDDAVVMEGHGFRVKGSGLMASGQTIRLLNDVTAVLY